MSHVQFMTGILLISIKQYRLLKQLNEIGALHLFEYNLSWMGEIQDGRSMLL